MYYHMNGTGGHMLDEIRNEQKDKYHMVSVDCKTVVLREVESRIAVTRDWGRD
jgi:hypothetical protein